jgi:uncharacterized protein YaaN involved in tellurite resistance
MNLWQKAADLQRRIEDIEQQAESAGIDPYSLNQDYGIMIDDLAEIQIIIWEAEANA